LSNGEIAYAEARHRVLTTRKAADGLNALLTPGQTIAELYQELEPNQGEPTAGGSDPRTRLQFGVLNLLLDRYFRSDRQKAFRKPDDDELA